MQHASAAMAYSQLCMRMKGGDSSRAIGRGCEVDRIMHTTELATVGPRVIHFPQPW